MQYKMTTAFRCSFTACELSFETRESLEEHVRARHTGTIPGDGRSFSDAVTTYSSLDDSLPSDSSESSDYLPTIDNPSLSSILDRITLPDNPMSSIGSLSNSLILHVSDQVRLDSVTILVLSDVGLSKFTSNTDFDLQLLRNLKELNLDFNYISDLTAIGTLKSLRRLSLGNNVISDLRPLSHLRRLQYLSVPKNEIKRIDGLEKLEKLSELDISRNRISTNEAVIGILRNLPSLEVLCIKANPFMGCEPHMRYTLIAQLKLHCLDGESVTSLDYDIAFNTEIKRLYSDSRWKQGRNQKKREELGARGVRSSGITARLMQDINEDKQLAGLIRKLSSKVHCGKNKEEISVEVLVGKLMRKLVCFQ